MIVSSQALQAQRILAGRHPAAGSFLSHSIFSLSTISRHSQFDDLHGVSMGLFCPTHESKFSTPRCKYGNSLDGCDGKERATCAKVDSPLPPDDAGPELEIVKQILNYFLRNSKAADTLEGIARWRLLEEQVHRSFQQTELALTWLVEQGFLEEVKTVGSSRIFRLAPQGMEKTARFLAGEKSAQKDKKKPDQ